MIAGIAYEYLKFSAARQNHWFMRLLIKPGLWLQSLTTREPDAPMLEVGIAALKRLLVEEQIQSQPESQPGRQKLGLDAV